MDLTVQKFVGQGPLHSTSRSHRAAAKSYSEFLLNQKKSTDKNRLRISREQAADLNQWDPNEPAFACPLTLAQDAFFARFLIYTFQKIEAGDYAKPTIRARQGWVT